jgi:hypothetical protein
MEFTQRGDSMRVREFYNIRPENMVLNVYREGNGRYLWWSTHFPSPMLFEDVENFVVYKTEMEIVQINSIDGICINLFVREETSTERLEREYSEKISLIRATELATELLCGEFEAEPYEAVEFCRNLDLSETEIDFLVPEEYKKYFDEE